MCAVFAACNKNPDVDVRTVTLHVPAACAAGSQAYATYYELGDFEPGSPQEGHYLDDVGAPLPEVSPQARALVVRASQAPEAGGSEGVWEGVADVTPSGNVDVLVLPELTSCALTGSVGARTGSTLGWIAPGRVLLVGGDGTPSSFLADFDTGALTTLTSDLLHPRSHATVTPFGSGALVAGGVAQPSGPTPTVLQTAEVYDSSAGGFEQQSALTMSAARTEHGAIVLATGETLLVG